MKEEEKYTALIAKYLSGNLENGERKQLLEWVQASTTHQAFFEEMNKLWALSETPEEPMPDFEPGPAWNRLEAELSSSKKGRSSIWGLIIRAAALILIVIALAWWLFQPEEEWSQWQTASGEERAIQLPDGSMVWLNEETKLSYRGSFEKRTLELEGEAFFEVVRMEESPFTIRSEATETKVLGTSFNLRAYPNETQVEVTVETGTVLLSRSGEEEGVVLEAGRSGIFRKTEQMAEAAEEKLQNASAWRTGRLEFSDDPVSEVEQTLERYYGVEIDVRNSDILKCHFTGQFEQAKIKEILDILTFLFELDIREENGRILIDGKGC